jgi:hypothetical protein
MVNDGLFGSIAADKTQGIALSIVWVKEYSEAIHALEYAGQAGMQGLWVKGKCP